MTTHATTANPIVAFVVAWEADHAGADCPLSALCDAFSQTSMSMERLLLDLEIEGAIARPYDRAAGRFDVRMGRT